MTSGNCSRKAASARKALADMQGLDIRMAAPEARRAYLPLLLDADPCEEMLARYLTQGEMFVVWTAGQAVCEALVVPLPGGICELKNLATHPDFQRQGYASLLLEYLFLYYRDTFSQMQVGTSEKGMGFYARLGFAYSHTDLGFFTRNYPAPVYEDGALCADMYYMRRALQPCANQ